jgi:hypothetical protein
MADEELHISDQDLLRGADGELPGRRAHQVRAHLAACWLCRTRLAEVEATIADFVHLHCSTLDPQLRCAAGPRALLKSRLAQAASKSGATRWPRFLQFFFPRGAVAYVAVALFVIAIATVVLLERFAPPRSSSSFVPIESAAVPNRSLTPGATRPVSINDVCSIAHEEVVRNVPASLRQRVLQEYGIANARAEDYEIDFLIAPRLGGAEDIHNLWPEPYALPTWNAHVKDALEEHLHRMVCQGSLDLRTAQRDISTDWIAAYKKYFHTERPLATSAIDEFDSPDPAASFSDDRGHTSTVGAVQVSPPRKWWESSQRNPERRRCDISAANVAAQPRASVC